MSTTRCVAVIVRVLVRSRFAPTVLTALNLLLDTSHVVTALLLALAGVAVSVGAQPEFDGPGHRATTAAGTGISCMSEIGTSLDDTQTRG
jgi:hypothetical protein